MRIFKKAPTLLSPNDSLQNTVQLAFQDLSTGAVLILCFIKHPKFNFFTLKRQTETEILDSTANKIAKYWRIL